MGNHKHYRDRKGNKGASREAARQATRREKSGVTARASRVPKWKVQKMAEYAQAKRGQMNNFMGQYQPIHTFVLNGMVLGYKAGYRIA